MRINLHCVKFVRLPCVRDRGTFVSAVSTAMHCYAGREHMEIKTTAWKKKRNDVYWCYFPDWLRYKKREWQNITMNCSFLPLRAHTHTHTHTHTPTNTQYTLHTPIHIHPRTHHIRKTCKGKINRKWSSFVFTDCDYFVFADLQLLLINAFVGNVK